VEREPVFGLLIARVVEPNLALFLTFEEAVVTAVGVGLR
jgi:hypothetical protein